MSYKRQRGTYGTTLDHDIVDHKAGLRYKLYDPLIFAGLTAAAWVAGPEIVERFTNKHFAIDPVYAAVASLALAGRGAIEIAHRIGGDSKKGINYSEQLGYNSTQLTYRGKESIKIADQQIQKGDNVLYVQLPDIAFVSAHHKRQETDPVVYDLYDMALAHIKAHVKGLVYKAVLVDLPKGMAKNDHSAVPQAIAGELDRFDSATFDNIFAGKRAKPKNPYRQIHALSPQDFDGLKYDYSTLFERAIRALGSRRTMAYYQLVRTARSSNERQAAVALLKSSVDRVLAGELERQGVAGPRVIYAKTNHLTASPIKIYPTARVITDTEGIDLLVESSGTYSSTRWLEEVVGLAGESKIAVVASDKLWRAQLASEMRRLLRERPIEVLMRRKKPTEAELLAQMKDLGLVINRKRAKRGVPGTGFSYLGDFYNLKHRLRPYAFATAAYVTASAVIPLARHIHLPESSRGIYPYGSYGAVRSVQLVDTEAYHQVRFPERVPFHSLDWRITAFGDISPNGYYVASTGDNRTIGTAWRVVTERAGVLNVSHDIDNIEGSHLTVMKRVFAGDAPDGIFNMKLPVKEGTKVAAIAVTNKKQQQVGITTYVLRDGTIELYIPAGLKAGYLDINYVLVSAASNQVKATRPIIGPDSKQLEEPALSVKAQAVARATRDNISYNEVIVDLIRRRFLYSIDPPNKDRVNTAMSTEKFVNEALQLTACDCDICTALAVDLSALVYNDKDFLNVAYGYMHNVVSLGGLGSSNYLRGEESHAFPINQNGDIEDSTPGNILGDAMTKQYIDLLINGSNPEKADKEWLDDNVGIAKYVKYKDDEERDIRRFKLFIMFSLGFFGAAAALQLGVYGAEKGARFAIEHAKEAAERGMLGALSEVELARAYHLFTSISLGEESRDTTILPDDVQSKADLLAAIRRNTTPHAIEQYVRDHDQIDDALGLSIGDRIKFHVFANYLAGKTLLVPKR